MSESRARNPLITSWLAALLGFSFCSLALAQDIPSSARSERAIQQVEDSLRETLQQQDLEYGAPIFIRIFKASATLEVWLRDGDHFEHFKDYDICDFSGNLGPKTREGDNQAPEGFYFVPPGNLNPWSSYHLAFNLGYPNTYERARGWTGSALMVHGKCVSIGCYAMTDPGINEIYALAHAAFENGQSFFRVHSFPFELTQENLQRYREHRWYGFWENLKEGYDYFNNRGVPPNMGVRNGRYAIIHEGD